jgi:aromatic ring-opening dioxygenase LigB subunit
MPLVYAAIAPHSPLLIPTVGKKHLLQLAKTEEAFKHLEADFYVARPETVIVISPHGQLRQEAFTINLMPEFDAGLEEFGDLGFKMKIPGDVGLAYRIREDLETSQPLRLISEPRLDYGSLVPFYLLTKMLPKTKIIPLYYSGLDSAAHFAFGQSLKRQIFLSDRRIAVLASSDLSHRLTKEAPGGYSPKAQKFDNKLMDLLRKNQSAEVVGLNQELVKEAGECGLRSILILLGLLDGVNVVPERLSYEAPFGVGYLTMRYRF